MSSKPPHEERRKLQTLMGKKSTLLQTWLEVLKLRHITSGFGTQSPIFANSKLSLDHNLGTGPISSLYLPIRGSLYALNHKRHTQDILDFQVPQERVANAQPGVRPPFPHDLARPRPGPPAPTAGFTPSCSCQGCRNWKLRPLPRVRQL